MVEKAGQLACGPEGKLSHFLGLEVDVAVAERTLSNPTSAS